MPDTNERSIRNYMRRQFDGRMNSSVFEIL